MSQYTDTPAAQADRAEILRKHNAKEPPEYKVGVPFNEQKDKPWPQPT